MLRQRGARRLPPRLGNATHADAFADGDAGAAHADLAGPLASLATWVADHRRIAVAFCVTIGVAFAVAAISPAAPQRTPVLVAAHDLAAGAHLEAADVTTRDYPSAAVPDGALAPSKPVTGVVLSAPVRRGEPLTDVRVVGSGGLTPGPGQVAAPVRLADGAVAQLLVPGRHIDVLAAAAAIDAPVGPGTASTAAPPAAAQVVATDVLVLAVPAGDPDAGGGANADGTLVILATTSEQARALAAAAVNDRLSVTLLD